MREIIKTQNAEIPLSEIPSEPFPYIGVAAQDGERKFIQKVSGGASFERSFEIKQVSKDCVNFGGGYCLVQNLISDYSANHEFFVFENKESWVAWLAGGENTGKKIVKSRTRAVDEQKYYGVFIDSVSPLKGFITRESFRDGNFIAICTKGVTNGDGWSNCKEKTLEGAIKYLLGYFRTKVFEFDTDKELFEWLAK